MPLFQAIEHVFFDLDHTLWDYDRNCKQALYEMVNEHGLYELGITDATVLYETFNQINDQLWDLFDSRKISQAELRQRRFREVFDTLGHPEIENAEYWNDLYLQISPNMPHLIKGAKAILDYLKPKYKLHIITNGFNEIQYKKLQAGGIFEYFDQIVTSQCTGYRKPEAGIFEHALKLTFCEVKNAVMIGDNANTDMLGAHKLDMFYIFYNPTKQSFNLNQNWQVKHLQDIKTFL